jgi:hypothetical protein
MDRASSAGAKSGLTEEKLVRAFDRINQVLEEFVYPGATPMWAAIVVALLLTFVVLPFVRPLVRAIRRRRRRLYDPCLAYHQKMHEGER